MLFFCARAQQAAAALLCLLLAALAAPTRAALSPSEFGRVLAKFRAEAQGVPEVSNHSPRICHSMDLVRDVRRGHTRRDRSGVRPEWQDVLLRAITQVQGILRWDSPDSVSKEFADTLQDQTYDVILYYMPPFVKFEDKEGVSDPVRLRAVL